VLMDMLEGLRGCESLINLAINCERVRNFGLSNQREQFFNRIAYLNPAQIKVNVGEWRS